MKEAAKTAKVFPLSFDWENAPLQDAKARQAELRDVLVNANSIIAEREIAQGRTLTHKCWTRSQTQEQLKRWTSRPDLLLAQCRDEVADGREAFRDNGTRDEFGNLSPTICCNHLCFQVYQMAKSESRHNTGLKVQIKEVATQRSELELNQEREASKQ